MPGTAPGRLYECEVCQGHFVNASKLARHRRIHLGERLHVCKVAGCEATYTRKDHLQRHVRTAHEAPTIPCDVEGCNAMLATRQHYLRHRRKHERERAWAERNAREGQAEAPFGLSLVCEDCGKAFRKWERLLEHRFVHTGIKPFVCPCGVAYATRSGLDRHASTRHGALEYMCEYMDCNAAFGTSAGLQQHLAESHPDLSLFICRVVPECSATFSSREALNDHRSLAHATVHSCEFCGKAFSRRTNLQTHMRCVHEGRRDYPCIYPGCDRSFGLRATMQAHFERVHTPVDEHIARDRILTRICGPNSIES